MHGRLAHGRVGVCAPRRGQGIQCTDLGALDDLDCMRQKNSVLLQVSGVTCGDFARVEPNNLDLA